LLDMSLSCTPGGLARRVMPGCVTLFFYARKQNTTLGRRIHSTDNEERDYDNDYSLFHFLPPLSGL